MDLNEIEQELKAIRGELAEIKSMILILQGRPYFGPQYFEPQITRPILPSGPIGTPDSTIGMGRLKLGEFELTPMSKDAKETPMTYGDGAWELEVAADAALKETQETPLRLGGSVISIPKE